MKDPAACLICGKIFLRRVPWHMYCSRRCKLDMMKHYARRRLGIVDAPDIQNTGPDAVIRK